MRTTLDIDEKLLEEIERATGEAGKSKAVCKALEEYLRMKAVKELLAMKIDLDWEGMEEEELKAMAEHEKERGE